tara:strand:- start:11497 stop:11724 length:228 start_codon:yes stop_codon:yes gene_type:complete
MDKQNWVMWAVIAVVAYWLFYKKGGEMLGVSVAAEIGNAKPGEEFPTEEISKFPMSSYAGGGTMDIPAEKSVSFL